jgi:hypothetical protein
MRIGVLSHDNGEYDAYVAYFDDPVKLAVAVAKLNEERMDTEAMELAAAEVRTETLHTVPDVIDDAFLDLLAGMLEDAGVYIESAKQRADRLAEEEAERLAAEIPFMPSPGQEEMGL